MEGIPLALDADRSPMLELLVKGNLECNEFFKLKLLDTVKGILADVCKRELVLNNKKDNSCFTDTKVFLIFKNYPDNNRARLDSRTPCGSRVRMRMQQSRAHSSKGVRGISVRRICVAVRDHSCRHAS